MNSPDSRKGCTTVKQADGGDDRRGGPWVPTERRTVEEAVLETRPQHQEPRALGYGGEATHVRPPGRETQWPGRKQEARQEQTELTKH